MAATVLSFKLLRIIEIKIPFAEKCEYKLHNQVIYSTQLPTHNPTNLNTHTYYKPEEDPLLKV